MDFHMDSFNYSILQLNQSLHDPHKTVDFLLSFKIVFLFTV